VAPERPARREPTPEEAAASRAQLCVFWAGRWAQTAAMTRAILPAGDVVDGLLADLEARRRESAATLCESDDP
jgi:hypothetical protein